MSEANSHETPNARLRAVLQAVADINLADPNVLTTLSVLKTRAKDALANVKRGRGNHYTLGKAREAALKKRHKEHNSFRAVIMAEVEKLNAETGRALSFQELADELNKRGIKPARSDAWTKFTVRSLLVKEYKEE